jgi:hypothetical protein
MQSYDGKIGITHHLTTPLIDFEVLIVFITSHQYPVYDILYNLALWVTSLEIVEKLSSQLLGTPLSVWKR